MSNPLFTVIITTFNRRDLLPRAIRSVLDQTFSDFELLVIDNGSTDDTLSVVRNIKDPRINSIANPNPSSSCDGPRNLGIKMAKGSLISFLDDDDIWYPERLEMVKKAFEDNPDAEAVCHYENRRVNGKMDGVNKYGPWSENMHEKLLYDGNCLSPPAMTIKKDLLDKLNGFDLREEVIPAADYDLWLRMTAKGSKIYFIETALGEFSITGNNWSTVDPTFESKIVFITREHLIKHEKKTVYKLSKAGLWRLLQLYLIAARSFFKAGNYMKMSKNIFEAVKFIMIKPELLASLYNKISERKKR